MDAPPPKTDGQQVCGTHPTGIHSCLILFQSNMFYTNWIHIVTVLFCLKLLPISCQAPWDERDNCDIRCHIDRNFEPPQVSYKIMRRSVTFLLFFTSSPVFL